MLLLVVVVVMMVFSFKLIPFIACNCISLFVFLVLAICSLVVVPITVTALDSVYQQKALVSKLVL